MAVVPSLNLRPDRPAPSAAPCPVAASVNSPSPVSPGSARPSPASSPFWVSASSPHSCAAASAPSNQSAASRAAPSGVRAPTATNPRKCAAIGLPGASKKRARVRPITPMNAPRSFAQSRRATQPVFPHVGFLPAPRATVAHGLFVTGSNFIGLHSRSRVPLDPLAARFASNHAAALAPVDYAAASPDFAACVSKPITPRLPQKNPRCALRIPPSILRNALNTSANLPLSNCSLTRGDTDLQPQRYPAPPASLRPTAVAGVCGCLRKVCPRVRK